MLRVDLYEDDQGRFHYQAYEPGAKNARAVPTLCGVSRLGMRHAAWFRVNDHRGRVHYDRGCGDCRDRLVI